ncbi:DUF1513 domain-containing protein [Pseudogemmobacter blasticus]|uniref:DUF1513 domain-containing protein n=1 Tax=Fuscovulum blasticum DSM 2131 TaxID=1188250 RepID=A0A2T4JD54_FUSBL|nr:DUF1513 domain-containing protein [Fuscovulum blasticum]PTE15842.1 DUF1513 domain-containing protein [Fuscovulum blasticum DSM 2131]
MASRRAFLAGLAAAAMPKPGWAAVGNPAFLAAGKTGEAYEICGLSEAGEILFRQPLPARGHAAAAHPLRPEAVAFARRPGTFALVLDCVTGAVRHRLTPPEGRQFNGHGAFSADGSLLMTSEVVAEGSAGRIGLWNGRTYARLGEWDSGGIGPHDMKRLPTGALVVANGGIATDPGDRSKLNIDTMRPNLTLLSSDGDVLDQAELDAELHQNSIRHLALTGDGVAFAMQWEGDAAEPVPLLGLWTPGRAPVLCPPAEAEMFAMKGYAGSIAAGPAGIGITSPKGGAVMLFDTAGAYLATHRRADVCGLAALDSGFLASDGGGALLWVTAAGMEPLTTGGPQWDNHVVPVGMAG